MPIQLYPSTEEYPKATPAEFVKLDGNCVLNFYRFVVIVQPIAYAVSSLTVVYLSGRIVSSLASAAGLSPLPIPSWASKSALVGIPIIIGTSMGIGHKLIYDALYEAAEKDIGVGHICLDIYKDPSVFSFFYKIFAEQFYTPAGANHNADAFVPRIIEGDLPSHVAIREKNIPYLRKLLEVAEQKLEREGLKSYLTHLNTKNESIWTIAENNETLTRLNKILIDLELSDLVPDVDL